MPKPRKKAAVESNAPLMPRIGDKVKPGKSEMVYTVGRVSDDGSEVDLYVPDMNLERFRVRTDTLTFVERKPPAKTSNPFTQPEPTFDAGEVLERIRTVQRENLQRLDDDIAILTKYLKTEDVPKAVISTLERMSSEQRESWKKAIERIEELLED
jgi:hypothetical protein